MIAEGMSNAQIMAQCPDYANQILKMDRIRQDILEERYRNDFRQLSVTYIFGPTGTGKTRHVMEENSYGNVFRVTDYDHPFERYNSEFQICFEESRSSLMIGDIVSSSIMVSP